MQPRPPHGLLGIGTVGELLPGGRIDILLAHPEAVVFVALSLEEAFMTLTRDSQNIGSRLGTTVGGGLEFPGCALLVAGGRA